VTGELLPQEIIRRKRDGLALRRDELEFIVRASTDGSAGRWSGGGVRNGGFFPWHDMDERVILTRAMMQSGRRYDWSDAGLKGPTLDNTRPAASATKRA